MLSAPDDQLPQSVNVMLATATRATPLAERRVYRSLRGISSELTSISNVDKRDFCLKYIEEALERFQLDENGNIREDGAYFVGARRKCRSLKRALAAARATVSKLTNSILHHRSVPPFSASALH
jgi:hypothetical protein